MFCRGDRISVELLMQKFKLFYEATCLRSNKNKCKVYSGGMTREIEEGILEESDFTKGTVPFKYLVVPLDSKKLIVHH